MPMPMPMPDSPASGGYCGGTGIPTRDIRQVDASFFLAGLAMERLPV
jgi:hypothetical protein